MSDVTGADLRELAQGFARFYERHYGPGGKMPELVSKGQAPKYAAFMCSDSRTPDSIFDQGPGGVFVPGRSTGALYRGYGVDLTHDSGIEYAVDHLKVSHLMVVAHYACGFIKGLVGMKEDQMRGILPDLSRPLPQLMNDCEPFYKRVRQRFNSLSGCRDCDSHHRHVVEESARWSHENFMTHPSVARSVREGRLTTWALVDDMEAGELLVMNPSTQQFLPLFQHSNPAVVPIMAPHCAAVHLANRPHDRFDAFKDTVGCAPGKSPLHGIPQHTRPSLVAG